MTLFKQSHINDNVKLQSLDYYNSHASGSGVAMRWREMA